MAITSFKLNYYSNMLLTMFIYAVLDELAIALPLSSTYSESRQLRSMEKPTSTPADQQPIRLHPGVIASVVIVTVAAAAAAAFIIRKYCCSQNNATYRYSELRHAEEQNAAREEYDDSDEDLLE